MRKLSLVLCAMFLLGMALPVYSAPTSAVNLDRYTEAIPIDYTQAAQLPLTGWFVKPLSNDRTMHIYIAPEASVRSYFTVIAIPDSADTVSYLDSAGWFDLMDTKGESLAVLEPGANGWGSAAEEASYLEQAMGVLISTRNAHGVAVFSTFSEYYLVGYGAGAAPLEYWAAQNPTFVISQIYADGTSQKAYLDEAGAFVYDGTNRSGYHEGITDSAEFQAVLERTGIMECAKKDVPVPTWLINYTADSASGTYWRYANDCQDSPVDGTYWQRKDSARPQTLFAVSQLPSSALGFSQVKFTTGATPSAADLYGWLSTYTRYSISFAYSNFLAYRLDYTAAKVRAQQLASVGTATKTFTGTDWKGNTQEVAILGQATTSIPGHGQMHIGVFTFSDNDGDGKNDPREYMVYVPAGFSGQKLPVVIIYPGMTQTDIVFFDCTQWYSIADKEGVVLAFVCETYQKANANAVTHVDSYLYQTALMTVLREDIDGNLASLDFTRVYGSAHSLGSMTTQDMARVCPDFFAALASTSGVTFAVDDLDFGFDPSSDKPIPTMLITGQSDLPGMLPDMSSAALTKWGNYFMKVNGLNKTVGEKSANFGADLYQFINKRHDIYTWYWGGNIPVVKWGMTLLRDHTSNISEVPLLWDFLKHFAKTEDGIRIYSASAFSDAEDMQTIFTRSSGSSSSGCDSLGLGAIAAVMMFMKKR